MSFFCLLFLFVCLLIPLIKLRKHCATQKQRFFAFRPVTRDIRSVKWFFIRNIISLRSRYSIFMSCICGCLKKNYSNSQLNENIMRFSYPMYQFNIKEEKMWWKIFIYWNIEILLMKFSHFRLQLMWRLIKYCLPLKRGQKIMTIECQSFKEHGPKKQNTFDITAILLVI